MRFFLAHPRRLRDTIPLTGAAMDGSKAMGIEELLQEKREEILQIAARHGARNVRVFGSVARGEADERSDIDFLVEMERGRSLFDHVALIRDLEHALTMRVDVATVGGLKERIRDRVLREAITL